MFKNKYPHQEVHSLYDLIKSKWYNELTEDQRGEYVMKAKELQLQHHQQVENNMASMNSLK